jgi:predicted nucleic acid-binding protein
MLDTNVFNDVLDGKVDTSAVACTDLVATHIQRDEIQKTKDQKRREGLMATFGGLTAGAGAAVGGSPIPFSKVVPTESMVWNVSNWGEAKWGVEDDLYERMLVALDRLNKSKKNNPQDILIAETAVRNGWVLVTADADLSSVVAQFGGECCTAAALWCVTRGADEDGD